MEKIYINDLVIEVTRQCNLSCNHCMRGPAQKKDINIKYVNTLFKYISHIGTITFSGGEPSLKPYLISDILLVAQHYNIEVQNFYCATNGVNADGMFCLVMLNWYNYCTDNELSTLHLSNDDFHEILYIKNVY
jgi:molybdenum cofactor biosynthesis enzyme MoaA